MTFQPNILLRWIIDMTPSLECLVSPCLEAQLVQGEVPQCQCISCTPGAAGAAAAGSGTALPAGWDAVGLCWEQERGSCGETVSSHARN